MKNNEREYLMYLIPRMEDSQIHNLVMSLQKTVPSKSRQMKQDAYKVLMDMIGCDQAKDKMRSMIAAYQMFRIAGERNHNMAIPRFHAVFVGNPGSNKTTCAKLYAQILFQKGIIKKDIFGELSRASLCGRYQGETAQKVQRVFQKYAGGVIFIDEAYSLDDRNENGQSTYGEEAVNELIVNLEKYPETVVIMAGYPGEMEKFLMSNPGLCSRIPYKVEFKDYTVEELVQITHRIAQEKGYSVDSGADEHLKKLFAEEKKSENFSNGRYCRNLVEYAIGQKGEELGIIDADGNSSDCSRFSDAELFSLNEANFPECKVRKISHTIGFY